MTKELSEAQLHTFYPTIVAPPMNDNMEARSNKLREWYRVGQSFFRSKVWVNHVYTLNALLQSDLKSLDYDEREGFLMGWQSDAYAYDNGLAFSVEGSHRIEPEDTNEHTKQTKGHDVLVESDQSGQPDQDAGLVL